MKYFIVTAACEGLPLQVRRLLVLRRSPCSYYPKGATIRRVWPQHHVVFHEQSRLSEVSSTKVEALSEGGGEKYESRITETGRSGIVSAKVELYLEEPQMVRGALKLALRRSLVPRKMRSGA